MNESQLETFLIVSKYKSYSKSANLLNITQPTVTSRIKALEDILQFKLFKRVGHEICLTNEAIMFVDNAKSILFYIKQAKNIANSVKKPSIKIGISPGYSSSYVVELLKTIKLLGEIDVKITAGYDSTILNEKILSGELDLIFTREPIINKEDLISEYLFNNRLVAVLSKKHPLSKKETLQLEDLNNETIISYKRNSPLWKLIDKKLPNSSNVTRFDLDNNEMLLRSVRHEIGIGIIPKLAFDKRYSDELTTKIINEVSQIPNNVYVHYRNCSSTGPLSKKIIYAIINYTYNENES